MFNHYATTMLVADRQAEARRQAANRRLVESHRKSVEKSPRPQPKFSGNWRRAPSGAHR